MGVFIGVIEAQCMGPNKAAVCTLIDRRDGTFELIIKPLEGGSHKLVITYGCEPVPGLSCHSFVLL